MSTDATVERGRAETRAEVDVTDATLAEVRAFARDRAVYLERRGGRTRLVAAPR
ncbi:hypothetical protein [Candidatus Halobonum tyrrellensis]|nr:hypothetical protein [Candidatus Halobonum tyrrellensis]